MRPLYEINQDILDCIDDESGEILDVEKLDALQMEREAKLEGVALWIKDLRAESEAVKAEADKLTARKKALDNKVDGLKNWLQFALRGEKMSTPRCKVYYTHSTKVTTADEAGLINFLETLKDPERFLKFQEPELKKNEIKQALKDGFEIPGAKLEVTESMVIK